ncbi:hypothetical protein [Ancylobacter sp.]|uniref:hypothetical protein n=1 Tax=Ancylobacter sp. TaxID=1872567 RepID=UPI003D0B563F
MKPSQWRLMAHPECPVSSIVDKTAALHGEDATDWKGDQVEEALSRAAVDQRGQIANALTGMMLQAAALRRNSINSGMNDAAITSSCDHLVECAKRVWQLLSEQPELLAFAGERTMANSADTTPKANQVAIGTPDEAVALSRLPRPSRVSLETSPETAPGGLATS